MSIILKAHIRAYAPNMIDFETSIFLAPLFLFVKKKTLVSIKYIRKDVSGQNKTVLTEFNKNSFYMHISHWDEL